MINVKHHIKKGESNRINIVLNQYNFESLHKLPTRFVNSCHSRVSLGSNLVDSKQPDSGMLSHKLQYESTQVRNCERMQCTSIILDFAKAFDVINIIITYFHTLHIHWTWIIKLDVTVKSIRRRISCYTNKCAFKISRLPSFLTYTQWLPVLT